MKSDKMRPLTISLSPQQLARLSKAVESGAYASNSEVLRDALRLWEQREELRELELARLKQAYRKVWRAASRSMARWSSPVSATDFLAARRADIDELPYPASC